MHPVVCLPSLFLNDLLRFKYALLCLQAVLNNQHKLEVNPAGLDSLTKPNQNHEFNSALNFEWCLIVLKLSKESTD